MLKVRRKAEKLVVGDFVDVHAAPGQKLEVLASYASGGHRWILRVQGIPEDVYVYPDDNILVWVG